MYDIYNLSSFSTSESYFTVSPSQYFATISVVVDGPARTLTVVKKVAIIFNIELFFFWRFIIFFSNYFWIVKFLIKKIKDKLMSKEKELNVKIKRTNLLNIYPKKHSNKKEEKKKDKQQIN